VKFGDVRYAAKAGVATITLHRPERFNAISAGMPANLAGAVAQASGD